MMPPSPKIQQQQPQKLPSPVPSLTQVEFPPLTHTTTLTKSEARSLQNDRTQGDGKGEMSMTSCLTSSWSNAVKTTKEYDTVKKAIVNDANDDISSSTSSVWMRGIPPLPLQDMESTHSENRGILDDDQRKKLIIDLEGERMAGAYERYHNVERHSFHSAHQEGILLQSTTHSVHKRQTVDTKVDDDNAIPFSTYTTMSISALLNDIGTLFARSNRVDEARMRYRLCVETARAALDDIQVNESDRTVSMRRILPPQQECKKVMEAEGLAWFRHKLILDGGNDDTAPAPSSHSSFANNNKNWNDIVHDIHQHQKLDCPTEYVYSCNGLTPLGLEYICDPLPVLGSLRKFISGTGRRRSRGTDTTTTPMECMALIAARLNIASLDYRIAGGGSSEKLQQVLTTLELALEECREFSKFGVDGGSKVSFILLLQAVVYSNIGTVMYRLNKVRESMTSFEAAKSTLEKFVFDPALVGDEAAHDGTETQIQSTYESHDDNRFPPHYYLELAVHMNLARVSLRLSKLDEASKYCEQIFAENTTIRPLQRWTIRSQGDTDKYHHGSSALRRSSSSSSASNAAFNSLETAMIAYEHDVDRRSQWLRSVAEHYITGLIHEAKGDTSDYKEAWHHYNRLLSLARVKLDHRHVYICTLLERRGAVLFEQRKLQCSMLSFLACLKILEHHQTTGSNVFNEADLSRVLYGVARVLHDREEYHDALHMYHRALKLQRTLAALAGGRPTLDIIKTLCNISRVHHLSGEIDAALGANREVLDLSLILLDGKIEHPFLIHRLKIEGNILVGKSKNTRLLLIQCLVFLPILI
jgi:tetratricopeptide (TPR) repeat protein